MRFSKPKLTAREEPRSVLMVRPDYFQVVDTKNPYMTGQIDEQRAHQEWDALSLIYQQLRDRGVIEELSVLPGAMDCEDMVFCANQSLPWKAADGSHHVLMSNMRHESRQREVPFVQAFYEAKNYTVHHLPEEYQLEGMGDCIFHPYSRLLWMGYGFRTAPEVQPIISELLDIEVIPLHLISPYFYHLDTCFLPLNEHVVVICTEAFDEASLDRIYAGFDRVYEVDRKTAADTFCLNTHCIYNKDEPVAIVPGGSIEFMEVLEEVGYQVMRVDTGEFIKAGGSVYCMKMMYH